jgi:hypothetical protein
MSLALGFATICTMILLMLGAAGCGSDNGTTVQGNAASGSASAGPEEAGQQSGESDGVAGRKARRDSAEAPEAGRNGRSRADGAGKANGAAGRDDSARRRQVKRKLEQECPPDADAASCEAMVDGFIAGRGDPKAKPLNDPEDCTQTRSEEECETDLRAQKAAEDTYSVDVEECLDNPTPRCEAVLRPFFERQQAAEEAGR